MNMERDADPGMLPEHRGPPVPPGKNTGRIVESPFMLENETAYRRWRTRKLACLAEVRADIATPVAIAASGVLGEAQRNSIIARCRQSGIAFYSTGGEEDDSTRFDRWTLRLLCSQLGLHTPVANPHADADAVSDIRVTPGARYIPYTTAPLKWHTDGYYNDADNAIGAFAMHCVNPAETGGDNEFFDPEILYILLRDENPDYITALMHPEALSIPGNPEEQRLDDSRRQRSAPVLTVSPEGELIARYTQRSQHISWRGDRLTGKARDFILKVLTSPGEHHVRHRLNRGEGVICNNVIHNRSGFDEPSTGSRRRLYRVRYRQRVAGTGYATLIGDKDRLHAS